MSIYTIGDLHLSFRQNNPINLFGDNWNGHAYKIRKNWIDKVKEEDYVILPGDFSWAMYLKDTYKDFEYLEKLPGNKILLKGNHDYWWGGISKMDEYLKENNFSNINFLYNNAYLIENVLIVGTRGWNLTDSEENEKMLNRECIRLKLSIDYGINKFGNDKEIIVFMHYPPISKAGLSNGYTRKYIEILKEYGVKKCYYGHLHGSSHNEAIEGNVNGIEFYLVSSDYLNFNLVKVK